jgi:hypothetical protein
MEQLVERITGRAVHYRPRPDVDPRQTARGPQRAVGRVETSMGKSTSRDGDEVVALLYRALAVVAAPTSNRWGVPSCG